MSTETQNMPTCFRLLGPYSQQCHAAHAVLVNHGLDDNGGGPAGSLGAVAALERWWPQE